MYIYTSNSYRYLYFTTQKMIKLLIHHNTILSPKRTQFLEAGYAGSVGLELINVPEELFQAGIAPWCSRLSLNVAVYADCQCRSRLGSSLLDTVHCLPSSGRIRQIPRSFHLWSRSANYQSCLFKWRKIFRLTHDNLVSNSGRII